MKMVLPSPSRLVAREIRDYTMASSPICLTVHLMGGGPSSSAVKDHLARGLPVYSLPNFARTLHDDLERVASLGVQMVEEVPDQARKILLSDLRLDLLKQTLTIWGEDCILLYRMGK